MVTRVAAECGKKFATRGNSRVVSTVPPTTGFRPSPGLLPSSERCRRWYNFASFKYASCFGDVPKVDTADLRRRTLEYLQDEFRPQQWYDEPVCSLLRGKRLMDGAAVSTNDALNNVNGLQHHATPDHLQMLVDHIQSFETPYRDLRGPIRRIEQQLLTTYAPLLVANQCVDFHKQDGVTEMEESVQANAVERRLNDQLMEDEQKAVVTISRRPIFVACVSNFSNFLDLFRKTVRSLELGIPCVVLGRTNTVQHSFRWAALLVELLEAEGVDPSMLTYLSCTVEQIQQVLVKSKHSTGMLYATCSRDLAAILRSSYPSTVASTGGPNTLVSTAWTKPVQEAIRISATIESSGQCTALRHCVVPSHVNSSDVESVFDTVTDLRDGKHGLESAHFDGIFRHHTGSSPHLTGAGGEYTKHPTKDVYYKLARDMPQGGINEYWRKVVVDFTMLPSSSEEGILRDSLPRWLNVNQPISLGINEERSSRFRLAKHLFETTSLVVYTVGSTDGSDSSATPALSCQARPQEAEIFGEFPPRSSLFRYTKYPVVVPSSNPSYDTTYTSEYLSQLSTSQVAEKGKYAGVDWAIAALSDITDPTILGYCVELVNYIVEAAVDGPRMGYGDSRTVLWGLQRPPSTTYIRCSENVTLSELLPVFLPFFITNARNQLEISVDPSNIDLMKLLDKHGVERTVQIKIETDETFDSREKVPSSKHFNVVRIAKHMTSFPLVGNFVSLLLPLGHIKSTQPFDEEFVEVFKKSDKWLRLM